MKSPRDLGLFIFLALLVGLACYGLHNGAMADIADEELAGDWR